MSGRLSVGCKSPLTGGIKEANAGGQTFPDACQARYAAIVIEGKPKNDDTLYKVIINKDGVKILPDNSLRMLGNYATVDKVKEEFGDKVSVISIGPAGEMKMSAASIACTDMEMRPTRHAGRGGVGAVMGSKGVKAIVIDDTGMKMRTPKNPEAFKDASKKGWKASESIPSQARDSRPMEPMCSPMSSTRPGLIRQRTSCGAVTRIAQRSVVKQQAALENQREAKVPLLTDVTAGASFGAPALTRIRWPLSYKAA